MDSFLFVLYGQMLDIIILYYIEHHRIYYHFFKLMIAYIMVHQKDQIQILLLKKFHIQQYDAYNNSIVCCKKEYWEISSITAGGIYSVTALSAKNIKFSQFVGAITRAAGGSGDVDWASFVITNITNDDAILSIKVNVSQNNFQLYYSIFYTIS